MFKAMKILRRKYGLSPVRSEKVQSRQQLTPKDYEDLLNRNGLEVFKQEVDTVPVPVEGWLDISTFSDFIEGTMPGVPMDKASLSLQEAVKETYSDDEGHHRPYSEGLSVHRYTSLMQFKV